MNEALMSSMSRATHLRDEIERARKLLDDTYDLITAETASDSGIRLVRFSDQPGEPWSFTGGYSALVSDRDVTVIHQGRRIVRVWDDGNAIDLDDATRASQAAAILAIIAITSDQHALRHESNLWYEEAVYELLTTRLDNQA